MAMLSNMVCLVVHRNVMHRFRVQKKLMVAYIWVSIDRPLNTLHVCRFETKAQTFRYGSLLSEQNENVLIWSAYNRNKIGTFLFAPNCSGIKTERLYFKKIIAKRNQNVSYCARVF
jgi:hypothetical protein